MCANQDMLFVFGGMGVWTWDSALTNQALTKQALYYFSHISGLENYWGCCWTLILLIYAYWVAKITVMSH
jgi:hypothetical protein